jgi:hypothetical protein
LGYVLEEDMDGRTGARRARMSAPTARKPAADDSRGGAASRAVSDVSPALRGVVLAAGLTGAILLIVADLSTLIEVKAVTAVIDRIPGHQQHSYAMLILGLFALVVTALILRGGGRPAMLALTLIGLIAGGVAVIGDLPDVHETGLIGREFESASASPKAGFYLETLGAALLIFGGGGALILSAPGRADGRERRRRAAASAGPASEQPPAETASERAERRRREREEAAEKREAASKGPKKPPAAKGSARKAEGRARAAEKEAERSTPTEPASEEADGARPPEKAGARARSSRRRRRR